MRYANVRPRARASDQGRGRQTKGKGVRPRRGHCARNTGGRGGMTKTPGTRTLRIGAGSAWWGDRVEPAALNAERGDLDYLSFETMAEATVSAAQVRKRRDP